MERRQRWAPARGSLRMRSPKSKRAPMSKYAIFARFLLLGATCLGAGCQAFTASEQVSEPDIARARAFRSSLEGAQNNGAKTSEHAAPAEHAGGRPPAGHGHPMPSEEAAPETATASHILVRYVGTLRAGPDVTRSKEDAKKLAEDIAAKAKRGADFAALANEYTEDPSGRGRGGKLGTFGRGRMVPEFDRATFALQPGQVSGVIESAFGYHIIYREK